MAWSQKIISERTWGVLLIKATNKQIFQVMVLDPMIAAGQVVEVAKQFKLKHFLAGVTQPSVINKQIRKEQVTNIMIWHPSTSRCCCPMPMLMFVFTSQLAHVLETKYDRVRKTFSF